MLLAASAVVAYLALSLLDGPAHADPPSVGTMLSGVASPLSLVDQGISDVAAGVSRQKPLDHADRPEARPAAGLPAGSGDEPTALVRPVKAARAPEPAATLSGGRTEHPAVDTKSARPRRHLPAVPEAPAVGVVKPRDTRIPALAGATGALATPKTLSAPAVVGVARALGVPEQLGVPEALDVPAVASVAELLHAGVVGALGVPRLLDVPAIAGMVQTLGLPDLSGTPTAAGVVGTLCPTETPALARLPEAGDASTLTATLDAKATPGASEVVTGPPATTETTVVSAGSLTVAAAVAPAQSATTTQVTATTVDAPTLRSVATGGNDHAPVPVRHDDVAGGSARIGGESAHERPIAAGRSTSLPALAAGETIMAADIEVAGQSAEADPPSG
jgi:hypothetical protein